jgi:1-acyl-sn-glycerol-3-phosphate acyltransferase
MTPALRVHPAATVLAGAAKLLSGAYVRWAGCAPEARQRIYFANHTSHLDFVVVWASLPGAVRALTRPVAARDYWDRGLVRRYLAARVFNALLIDRPGGAQVVAAGEPSQAPRQIVESMANAMGDQYSLILFPEGTRGTGETVGEFKGGLYYLCATKPGLELVPVYIENLNRILPKGQFLPVPLMSRVTFGPPIGLREGEAKRDFLERAREAVLDLREA